MLYRLSLIAALTATLAYSSPTLAQNTTTMTPMAGHHACPPGAQEISQKTEANNFVSYG
jgi:hypothetical protein